MYTYYITTLAIEQRTNQSLCHLEFSPGEKQSSKYMICPVVTQGQQRAGQGKGTLGNILVFTGWSEMAAECSTRGATGREAWRKPGHGPSRFLGKASQAGAGAFWKAPSGNTISIPGTARRPAQLGGMSEQDKDCRHSRGNIESRVQGWGPGQMWCQRPAAHGWHWHWESRGWEERHGGTAADKAWGLCSQGRWEGTDNKVREETKGGAQGKSEEIHPEGGYDRWQTAWWVK